jgi:hypothetical protein
MLHLLALHNCPPAGSLLCATSRSPAPFTPARCAKRNSYTRVLYRGTSELHGGAELRPRFTLLVAQSEMRSTAEPREPDVRVVVLALDQALTGAENVTGRKTRSYLIRSASQPEP